jgi:hypothetical protein
LCFRGLPSTFQGLDTDQSQQPAWLWVHMLTLFSRVHYRKTSRCQENWIAEFSAYLHGVCMIKENIFYAYQASLVAQLPNYVGRILPPWLLIIHCIICARIKRWNMCEPSLYTSEIPVKFFPLLGRVKWNQDGSSTSSTTRRKEDFSPLLFFHLTIFSRREPQRMLKL